MEHPVGNRIDDLVIERVADLGRAGDAEEWQRRPLADQGQMPGAEKRKRHRFEPAEILLHALRVVARAGAVRASNQDHHRFCHVEPLSLWRGLRYTCSCNIMQYRVIS